MDKLIFRYRNYFVKRLFHFQYQIRKILFYFLFVLS